MHSCIVQPHEHGRKNNNNNAQPFQVVEIKFDVFGKVPKAWLSLGRYGLGVDWLDANGNDLPSSGPNSTVIPTLFPWSKKVGFRARADLSYFATSEHPRGLILVIETHENNRHTHYLPVIVAGTSKIYESEHAALQEKLSETIKGIIQRKIEWDDYTKELATLRKSIVNENEILGGVFEILDESDESFTPFTHSEEDEKEAALEEKYKKAIESRGPLFRGLAGKMDGFELRVYSDDHGRHFHIIHKGKGINARYSFPAMKLLSYVAPTTIGAKTERKLQEFCKRPNIFSKFELEFAKRTQTI